MNVNAIEDFRELQERHGFLSSQHADLVKAAETLQGIIDELDQGMRRQFTEKFEEIRVEFDKAFKQLFGGGRGTLELAEDEDVLEAGIRIISQPPGKKLQNMMAALRRGEGPDGHRAAVRHPESEAVALLSAGRDRGGPGRFQRGALCPVSAQVDKEYAIYYYYT